jgi:lipoate-protein ligase A
VVCGKNQSIWAEANLKFCRENGIKPAKRLSGGGTVYHDPGNLNFCFITSRKKEWVSNFSVFNAPVISFLKSLGIDAAENERHDILIDGKKISGNAQHLSKNLLVSHATLLFNANLKKVSAALRHPYSSVESRGIDSKRVPVTNIYDHLERKMEVNEFSNRLFDHVCQQLNGFEFMELSAKDRSEIQKLADEKFSRDEWIYGQSPDTQIKMDFGAKKLTIRLEKGICRDLSYTGNEEEQKVLDQFLTNQLFSLQHLEKHSANFHSDKEKAIIHRFLEESGL